jgi:hypothetical protein
MKLKGVFYIALAGLLVTACAKGPDAIAPANIPLAAYTGSSCSNLSKELVTEKATLEAVESAQRSAATGDAVGVFLLGIPLASATGGDKEGDVAVSKGKVQSIELAMKSKGCRTTA